MDFLSFIPIIGLIGLSGLFSGLTLGLLSLDVNQLEIVLKQGSDDEKKWASKILPVRRQGNWLLCTLLLGNVAVNALLSILLAEMTSGLMGFLLSTILIVIFGEIIPQATCARYGLAIGYYTLPITYVFVVALTIFAWPISKMLDCMLGEEEGQLYTRAQMMELLLQQQRKVTRSDGKELEYDEIEMDVMLNVLQFKQKTMRDVMTPMNKVFSLGYREKLDFDCLARIFQSGHSRIPVIDGAQNVVVGLLFAKDLILLNPEDEFTVCDILKYYSHNPLQVDVTDKCPDILAQFKSGKSHLAIVRDAVESKEGLDTTMVNVGLVTIEDVIEALVGQEIIDETDILSHPEGTETASLTPKGLKERKISNNDMAMLSQDTFIDLFRRKRNHNSLSPQEVLTVYQVVSQEVPGAFGLDKISMQAAKKLLSQCEILELQASTSGEDIYLYTRGKQYDFFTLVLEGRLEVTAGEEDFNIALGPWKPLGWKALQVDTPAYVPDFSAKLAPFVPKLRYLKITATQYEAAIQGTLKGTEDYGDGRDRSVSASQLQALAPGTPPLGGAQEQPVGSTPDDLNITIQEGTNSD